MVVATQTKSEPKVIVSAKITPAIKQHAQTILNTLGLTTSTAIQLLFHQLVQLQGIPFSTQLDPKQIELSQSMDNIPKKPLKTTSVSAQLSQDVYQDAARCLYQLDITPSNLIQMFFNKLVFGADFPLHLDFTEGQRIRLNAMYGIGIHIAPTHKAIDDWIDSL